MARKNEIRPPKPMLAWAIADKWGNIYSRSIHDLRRDAIKWLLDPNLEEWSTWRKCYRRGFRVLRVKVAVAKARAK